MIDFVHLHVHTQYSILDGQASIPKLVDKALADGMRGMAITDHGNMMGIKEFFNYVKKLRRPDFKPIFGCEMYVARRGDKSLKEMREDQSGFHLVVLAKNETGYHNLVKLVSRAWVDGFYMRPRTDRKDLEQFHEGLIVCSACLGGEVPRKIVAGQIREAEETVMWFKRVFGEDYYLELQRHKVSDHTIRANRETYDKQVEVNKELLRMGEKFGIKCICTNDVHFVDEDNAEAHDRLICLSTGKDLDDPSRLLYTKQEWFKTRAEMNEIFADLPEVLANTCEILDKVSVYSIDHAPIMPNFEIPAEFGTEEAYRKKYSKQDLYEEFTRDENGKVIVDETEGKKKIEALGGYDKLYRIKLEADYLAHLTYEGAARKYGNPLNEEVAERIKYELHVMKTMGFPGYFLIVQDYIRAAREELHVRVGPGRGSAAGSAVAYCLGITLIDPLKYDLLFERFLNPDRISLPDIDVDFDDTGRNKVLNWVTKKYGEDYVAHIITYGTMAAKMAIKDVARVQKLPLEISNKLCKLIPSGPDGKPLNLPNAIALIPQLREAENSPDKLLRETISYAKMLEGNVRNTGVHPCGFIICKDKITDWVPVSTARDKETGEEIRCTQYDFRVIEETGLIKMDFLGLKTLSIINETLENIRLSLGLELSIDDIDPEDPATFQLFCDGKTGGTFQFESLGMQKYLRELQPSTLEDLIAMNALYRPGPKQYIPKFIARKHGRETITYDLPCMEKYLKDTYGVTVYQEQVMLLAREIAGFTRGESDTLRKAMGKKLVDKLNQMKPKFLAGGKANGYDEKVLEKIWEDWQAFASYAFNKSHATCYSWLCYQTAYLKANFPSQFMAGVMSRSLSDILTVAKLMDECKSMGIHTLGPDINESFSKFSVNSAGDIRFGLAAIKGVGEGTVEEILEQRRKGGEFKSVYDLVERINLSTCNKKALESMAIAGALDSFGKITREQYVLPLFERNETFLDKLIRYGIRFQQDKATRTASLFGMDDMMEMARPKPPENASNWTDIERLNRERELIGIYISGHPLDKYKVVVRKLCTTTFAALEELDLLANREITLGGIVTGIKMGISKAGNPFGIARMEDYSGAGEIALFGDDYARLQGYFQEGNALYITAKVEERRKRPGTFDLRVGRVEFLSDAKQNRLNAVTIEMHADEIREDQADELIEMLRKSKGQTQIFFNIIDPTTGRSFRLQNKDLKTDLNNELVDYLESNYQYSIN